MSGVADSGVTVDTADLDEAQQRLDRAAEDVVRAREGLDGLGGVIGLAVGADAVLDALGDLARDWRGRLEGLEGETATLRHELGVARDRYDVDERDMLSMLLDSPIDTGQRGPSDRGPGAGAPR